MKLQSILATCARSLVAGALLASSAVAADTWSVGLRQMHVTIGEPIPLALWYPSTKLASDAAPSADAEEAAPMASGSFPMILLSHGSGGWEMGHRDWAEYLARHGYVVVAPRHWGDSYDKPDGRGTDVQLIGRPLQAKAALDTVLGDAALKTMIDAKRIGMMGFSAGGYTTLVMAGARPNFARWHAHCEAHASEDPEFCPTIVWRWLPRRTRDDWSIAHETRIKAAVAMAPASILFDQAGLAGIKIPLRLYGASDDKMTQNVWNVSHVAAQLAPPVSVNFVAGGHFVFLAPCSSEMRERLPQLCIDAKGVDRAAIHQKIARELVDFFDAKLAPGAAITSAYTGAVRSAP